MTKARGRGRGRGRGKGRLVEQRTSSVEEYQIQDSDPKDNVNERAHDDNGTKKNSKKSPIMFSGRNVNLPPTNRTKGQKTIDELLKPKDDVKGHKVRRYLM